MGLEVSLINNVVKIASFLLAGRGYPVRRVVCAAESWSAVLAGVWQLVRRGRRRHREG